MPSSSDGVDAAAFSNTNPGEPDPLDSVLETTGRDRSLLLASVRYLLWVFVVGLVSFKN